MEKGHYILCMYFIQIGPLLLDYLVLKECYGTSLHSYLIYIFFLYLSLIAMAHFPLLKGFHSEVFISAEFQGRKLVSVISLELSFLELHRKKRNH
jgi:hypothetical protein